MSDSNGHATREALLKATKRRYMEDVTIPQFPELGSFRIRSLNERERARYESQCLSSKGQLSKAKLETQKRRLIALCLVDSAGELLLEETDIAALEELDSCVTQYLFDRCSEHCGFSGEDFDELVKNSETISVE